MFSHPHRPPSQEVGDMQRCLGVLELGLSVLERSLWWAPRATSAEGGSPANKGFDKSVSDLK